MASATLIAPRKDATHAYASALVAEGGSRGNVEYGPVSTPLLDEAGVAKPAAQLKAELVAALTALRNSHFVAPAPLPGLAGTVTL